MGGPGAGGPGAGAERAEVEDFGGRRGLAAKPVHGDKCLGWGTGSPGRAHDGWTREWVLPRGHLGQEACPWCGCGTVVMLASGSACAARFQRD